MGWGPDRLCQTRLIPRSPDGDNNISTYPNCEVVDNGNPHIRVGFQAEGEYGGADEEHRDYSNRLSKVFF